MHEDGNETHVELRAGGAALRLTRRGAEPLGWNVDGHDLLWRTDPTVWDRTSPILFPIVGRASGGIARVAGRDYPMGIHGFAAGALFSLSEAEENRAVLSLTDSGQTRVHYPFAFRLDVEYRLEPSAFSVSFRVTNAGDGPMPYAIGFHPGFAWPLSGGARAGHSVTFAKEERPDVPVITPSGLFSQERRTVPLKDRHLMLDDALMSREALCFLDARSRSLAYSAADGARLEISVENFPHFALWSRPPAAFLCIEAWTGHGDPDGYDGELAEKPSMRLLQADEAAHHAVHFVWHPKQT